MKKFLQEFKVFAMRGNALQLAVGVIIGGAFQSIVTALTGSILSPMIGLVAGHNFDTLAVNFLGVTLQYGVFITAVINFLITAFVVFLLVKLLNRLSGANKEEAPPAPAPEKKDCPFCMTPIPMAASRCPACTSHLDSSE